MTSKDAIREEYDKYRAETQSRNESVFNALSGLKRLVLGAVFERHFDAAATGDDTETDWERLTAYKNEAVYLRAHQNCVRVIYQIQVNPVRTYQGFFWYFLVLLNPCLSFRTFYGTIGK